jgi:hypothetical protein
MYRSSHFFVSGFFSRGGGGSIDEACDDPGLVANRLAPKSIAPIRLVLQVVNRPSGDNVDAVKIAAS